MFGFSSLFRTNFEFNCIPSFVFSRTSLSPLSESYQIGVIPNLMSMISILISSYEWERFDIICSDLKRTTEESPREARATGNVLSTFLSCPVFFFLSSVHQLLTSLGILRKGLFKNWASSVAQVYSDFLSVKGQTSPLPLLPSISFPTVRTRMIFILKCLQLYNTTCRFSDKKHTVGTGGPGNMFPLCIGSRELHSLESPRC